MKISEALDGLKENPAQIAVTGVDTIYPRALFWHPARQRYAIYELSLSYRDNTELSERHEIYVTEMAGGWTFTDFNSWYESRVLYLKEQQKKREEEAAAKKNATPINQ